MAERVIELGGISKIYRTGHHETAALEEVSMTIEKGEFVAVMGPSGSGKSTLMHIIGLLDVPTSGKYLLNEEDVSTLGKNQQAEIRNREIGFVFQQFNLLPRTSVIDNVLLPTIYGAIDGSVEKARKIIADMGLEEQMSNKSNELSGGQIQRVAIARALVMNPAIILADEPTGNLDSHTSGEIIKIFREINTQGATVVLITHEHDLAKRADRIVKIKDGRLAPAD